MRDLARKVALVTGAGSGIGRATAFALACKGVRLIPADVNEPALPAAETECAAQSVCLLAQAVDVSKRDEKDAFSVHRVHSVHESCAPRTPPLAVSLLERPGPHATTTPLL